MNRRPMRMQRGFSMIEVLVTLVILAFGLLGFALLQTMNLRYTQSANHRTQATNLAYDLLDQMRANRLSAAKYTDASFEEDEVNGSNCSRPVGELPIPVSSVVTRWQCQVVEALGDDATATVTYADGLATVTLTWGDRISIEAPTSFVVETRL
ncbi:type IV pilus modification protein PilV [Luteimonas sp. SX5]|uniref:Type IV pilus modification protein PilV n=1 Tax=Luteimonas galliterrae TaxID=2940486 RepID=A0ABT0MJS0_9GAMM|nr:type IV pilus modification protein PilV [Luteimonas galliterrae]MCL1635129.1 type IV pilus modification protein PilV [Luteimonas galliterrae]